MKTAMDDLKLQNATIRSTMLGREDHGIFTYSIGLEYDCGGQSFGGYALDQYDKVHDRRVGGAFGSEAIFKLLDVLGVERWEKLIGTPCRVKASWNKVQAIGHYLKDQWLDLDELALQHRKP